MGREIDQCRNWRRIVSQSVSSTNFDGILLVIYTLNAKFEAGESTDDQVVEPGEDVEVSIADGGDIDTDESLVQDHIGKFEEAVVLCCHVNISG